jgi:hypothetical protein
MRLLQIRARTDEDAECLLRVVAVYSPKRSSRSILIELQERTQADLLGMLAALETCLSANDIRSVRIELDGKKYTMSPSQRAH